MGKPDRNPGRPPSAPPGRAPDADRPFWYQVLTMFPFLFLPIVALVGILLSIVMPYLTGVRPR